MSPCTWMPRCLHQCLGKSPGYQACKVGLRLLLDCSISYSLPFFHSGIFLWFEPQMKSIANVLREFGNSSWLRIQTNTILFCFSERNFLHGNKKHQCYLQHSCLLCLILFLLTFKVSSLLLLLVLLVCCCYPGSLVLWFFFFPSGWFHVKLDAGFCQTHPVLFMWAQILVSLAWTWTQRPCIQRDIKIFWW